MPAWLLIIIYALTIFSLKLRITLTYCVIIFYQLYDEPEITARCGEILNSLHNYTGYITHTVTQSNVVHHTHSSVQHYTYSHVGQCGVQKCTEIQH